MIHMGYNQRSYLIGQKRWETMEFSLNMLKQVLE